MQYKGHWLLSLDTVLRGMITRECGALQFCIRDPFWNRLWDPLLAPLGAITHTVRDLVNSHFIGHAILLVK